MSNALIHEETFSGQNTSLQGWKCSLFHQECFSSRAIVQYEICSDSIARYMVQLMVGAYIASRAKSKWPAFIWGANIIHVQFPKKNNTWDSNVVPHHSTNQARQCLTLLSRWEAVLSLLYGHFHLKTQTLFIINHGDQAHQPLCLSYQTGTVAKHLPHPTNSISSQKHNSTTTAPNLYTLLVGVMLKAMNSSHPICCYGGTITQ